MKECIKCGKQLNDEDIFCNSCGARQDGGDLKGENKKVYSELVKTNIDFNEIKDVLIQMFLRPLEGCRNFVSKGKNESVIILTAILAVLQGVVGIWVANRLFSTVSKFFTTLSGRLSGTASLFGFGDVGAQISAIQSAIQIPYGKIFFENCIIVLIAILVLFGVIYLDSNVISKKKANVLAIYRGSIVVFFPILYCEFISVILSYIHVSTSIIVLLIGCIISIICLFNVMKENIICDENSSLYMSSILSILVYVVILFVSWKFFKSDMLKILSPLNSGYKIF